MNKRQKSFLYETIVSQVAKTVKKILNESIDYAIMSKDELYNIIVNFIKNETPDVSEYIGIKKVLSAGKSRKPSVIAKLYIVDRDTLINLAEYLDGEDNEKYIFTEDDIDEIYDNEKSFYFEIVKDNDLFKSYVVFPSKKRYNVNVIDNDVNEYYKDIKELLRDIDKRFGNTFVLNVEKERGDIFDDVSDEKETTDFKEIQSGEKLPAPLVKLKNMVNHNSDNLSFYGFKKRIYKGNPDYKINIGVDSADFDSSFTINLEVEDENIWNVYVMHTIEGLETEVAEGYLDINEFSNQVIDVIEEAGNSPEEYEEYCQ